MFLKSNDKFFYETEDLNTLIGIIIIGIKNIFITLLQHPECVVR